MQEQDYQQMREDIEKCIKKKQITQQEFLWHSSHICWGCGNEMSDNAQIYSYTATRETSRKEGAKRVYRTYSTSANILLCKHCYPKYADKPTGAETTKIIWYALTAIIALGWVLFETLTQKSLDFGDIFVAIFGFLLAWGMGLFIGGIVLYPISALIATVYLRKKGRVPKWDFDNIPKIVEFNRARLQ